MVKTSQPSQSPQNATPSMTVGHRNEEGFAPNRKWEGTQNNPTMTAATRYRLTIMSNSTTITSATHRSGKKINRFVSSRNIVYPETFATQSGM
jgi:hypothetical protein